MYTGPKLLTITKLIVYYDVGYYNIGHVGLMVNYWRWKAIQWSKQTTLKNLCLNNRYHTIAYSINSEINQLLEMISLTQNKILI